MEFIGERIPMCSTVRKQMRTGIQFELMRARAEFKKNHAK